MAPKTKTKSDVPNVRTRQLIIFSILFTGYAFYALNRKAVSLVLPELINSGLDKSDTGNFKVYQSFNFSNNFFLLF